MKKIGLIINPVAGMGGSVGLKGTDHMVEEARKRGAVPRSGQRTQIALEQLLPVRDQIQIHTSPGPMGGDLAKAMGFVCVLYDSGLSEGEESSESHTHLLASSLLQANVDLLLFSGGDGTARDIYRAVGTELPVLGIPAGVKIHSPVYAKTPKRAGQLALLFAGDKVTKTKQEEVLDIDEELYRQGMINTRLYGYLSVPVEKSCTQNRKAPTPLSETATIESMAHQVLEDMEPDTYYLIGAGTTTRGVMHLLGLPNTLIGVDLVCNRKLVEGDVYGDEILKHIKGKRTKLVVTITGGQGYLFGRGNQQLTPEVIKEIGRENIIILASKEKLYQLRDQPLMVDTFDVELNKSLCGYYRVIIGYGEYIMCRVSD